VWTLPAGDPRWSAFVAGSPTATPFHHPAWSRVLADCYGYRPFALAVGDAQGTIAAGIPAMEVRGPLGGRRWLSLPFTDSCEPLGDPAALYEGLDAARARAGVGTLEIRSEHAVPGAASTADEVSHVLALPPDPADALANAKANVRRNIAKAAREGVTVRRATDRADLVDVYYSLHVRTRRRLGVPSQPRAFFERLWDSLCDDDLAFVLLASIEGEAVAGAVFLAWNGTVVYKFGASDAGAWHARPNDALFAHAIRWSCEHGFRTLDFGKTELANEGLRRFKAGWGAEERPLVRSLVGGAARAPRVHAPPLGSLVIRRSPEWVCRAASSLYRYAA
jgi:CelD/BcsL family acetyltransferase involved in cellulose biosynthesis